MRYLRRLRWLIAVMLALGAVMPSAFAQDIGKWVLTSSVSTDDPTPSATAALRAEGAAAAPTLLLHCRGDQLQVALLADRLAPGLTLVTVRLEGEPPDAQAWPQTPDGRAVLYPGAAPALVERLQAHDSATVLVTAGASLTTARFDLRGLANALPALRQACGG